MTAGLINLYCFQIINLIYSLCYVKDLYRICLVLSPKVIYTKSEKKCFLALKIGSELTFC